MRLITIPISHYCERARWALEYVGLSYQEEQHLQMLHWPHARAAGGGKTVPVLVTGVPGQGVLTDSEDILRFANDNSVNGRKLYPDDATEREAMVQLERRFQDPFGVETRRIMYGITFAWGRGALRYNAGTAPLWERALVQASFPAVKAALKRYLDVSAAAEAEARVVVGRVMDEVAEILSDGRTYLAGETFSAVDLTFACMAAAVLCPSNYGVELPTPDEFPEDAARELNGYRAHPAGAFALRMFEKHRLPGQPVSTTYQARV